jgi:YHS domain-containing protein
MHDTNTHSPPTEVSVGALRSFSYFPSPEQTYGAVASASKLLVVDPICGVTMILPDAAGHVVYRGVSYYFCSEACHRRFTWQAGRSDRGAV